MAHYSFMKHLRVLFALICSLSFLSFGGWLVYSQFTQQHVTEPLLVQARQAQVDFESLLLNNPTAAGKDTDVSGLKTESTQTEAVPVSELTAMDLLNVTEVVKMAFNAVKLAKQEELIALQRRLIDTATQLNIAPQQLDFLRSPQAVNFMQFRAKRAWFNQEVEKRYYQLASLDGLLEQFPEARGDLYQEATNLIIDRDLIIFNMAKALAEAEDRIITEQDIADAQVQWQKSLTKL